MRERNRNRTGSELLKLALCVAVLLSSGCGDDGEGTGAATPVPTATRTVPPTSTPSAVPTSTNTPAATNTASPEPTPTSTETAPPTATASPEPTPTLPEGAFRYEVPLDPFSPWPKFRRNEVQNGRSPVLPVDPGVDPWVFPTGKGIFSTPVIDGEGTIYIGSADQVFYAIDHNGREKWRFETGEVIDSSALLDNEGRVIFGSGDGFLYALDRNDGSLLWRFAAEDPSLTSAFINWFEGNVAIGADGTLYAPNDNFCTYAVRRDTGEGLWCFGTSDQTWSSPAVNVATGRLFIGNNFPFVQNVFGVDGSTGAKLWNMAALGSVAASPLLNTTDPTGSAFVGAFDGFIRAYAQSNGAPRWAFGARDHIYASPAELSDGTLVQPSADGTIYALDPTNGSLRWAFDTREPIRSSPAVDGADHVYVGSGEGRLFVLNPDGTLRWSIRLIDDQRDDLNASPALGHDGVVIAGENGGVFFVPYDYCLREEAAADTRCTRGPGESLPTDGVFLAPTTRFGRLLTEAPTSLLANESLTLSLLVRADGDTTLALIDAEGLEVTVEPETPRIVNVSGDRRFLTIVPQQPYVGPEGGSVTVRVRGNYLVDFERTGLRFTGGRIGGSFDQSFTFTVPSRGGGVLPLPVPAAPGDEAGVFELYRLAAPLPTILPSYNQIGFDSIHYILGLIGGSDTNALAWGIEGRLAADGSVEVDPTSRVRFPLEVRYDGGLLTMINEAGFTIEFNGFPLPFQFFRVATEIDGAGNALQSPAINTKAICSLIDFYGAFLQALGYCNPDTDLLDVYGGAELRPYRGGVQQAPGGVGTVSVELAAGSATARFAGSTLRLDEHSFGVLLVDADTGSPLKLPYTSGTEQSGNEDGTVAAVTLTYAPEDVVGPVRVYVMVDTYPVHVEAMAPAS